MPDNMIVDVTVTDNAEEDLNAKVDTNVDKKTRQKTGLLYHT